jgi:hypothetical protein
MGSVTSVDSQEVRGAATALAHAQRILQGKTKGGG